MAPAVGDDTAFMQALARRMGTRLVVFVPARREPRSVWISGPGNGSDLASLADIGRDWLDRHRFGSDRPAVDGVERLAEDTVVIAPTWLDGGVFGALVASKERGSVWTGAELAFVRFATDYYAPQLKRWGARPVPARSIVQDVDSLPAGADLDSAIRRATSNDELFLRYQPEVELRTRAVVAVEALVRWAHPKRGELGPEAFIAVAERSELITILGSWVVDESLREFAGMLRACPGVPLDLRVNVSPVQVTGQLVSLFADALLAHDVSGERVCVEITENILSRDTTMLATILQALKRLGIHSAIDDLASGYSSLTRLRSLPVDVVKLDRGLVAGIDVDPRAQAIVTSLIRLADQLGVRLVAEGVETEAEASALLDIGCEYAQGHLFGRPMRAADIVEQLRDR